MMTLATCLPALPHDDRRAHRRWPVVSSRARLAWGAGRPPFHAVPAQFINISEGGAQICTDTVPEAASRVWVRLDSLPWEWVRATVQAVRGKSPYYQIHLAFLERCSPGVLEKATALELPPSGSWWNDPEAGLHLTFDLDCD
jgi:hypothetical protein